jgi:large subunit ribosomal protein L1
MTKVMGKLTKRKKIFNESVKSGELYTVEKSMEIIKKIAATTKVKFNESVDIAVKLGIDSKKSDQVVRGALVLPNGTGKSVKVAVFAQGPNADKATAAGADIVGFEDLAEEIKAGKMNFDVVIATPDAMRIVGQLGQILGPRGLMPNPKVGTVTQDVTTAVKNAKGGQVQYRTDKAGIVHSTIGKVSFEALAIKENLVALLEALKKAKPSNAKGVYLKKITLSSTMGPGINIDQSSL